MKLETRSIYIVQGIREWYPDRDGTISTKWFDSAYTDYEEAFEAARKLAWDVFKDISSGHEDKERLQEPNEVDAELIEFDFDAEGSDLSNVAGGYKCSWYPDEDDVYECFTAIVYQFVN